MLQFSTFIKEEFLGESLNSAVEFDMTDDTKMPKEIHASFEVDGTPYGASLFLTKHKRVYRLDFYRIANVKKRHWNFLKSSHARPCLSTVIKFVEASYPFIKPHMDGFICLLSKYPLQTNNKDVLKKGGSQKYTKFLERIMKKTYVTTFSPVPISKKDPGANNYIFFVKKSVSPSTLFTGSHFKKFDFSAGELNIDVLDALSEPYKKMSENASTVKSGKYAFGKIGIELHVDESTVSMLDAAAEKYRLDKKVKDEPTESENKISISADHSDVFNGYYGSTKSYISTGNQTTISASYLFAIFLSDAYDKIEQYGYDESVVNYKDIHYVLKEYFSTNKGVAVIETLKKELEKISAYRFLIKASADQYTSKDEDTIKTILKSFDKIQPGSVNHLVSFLGDLKSNNKTTDKDQVQKVEKVDLPFDLESDVPGFTKDNKAEAFSADSSPYGKLGWTIDWQDEEVDLKVESIVNMPSVKKWYDGFSMFKEDYPLIKNYTGETYEVINKSFRAQIDSKQLNYKELHPSARKLTELFLDAPKLDQPIWVYRNADVPNQEKLEPGDDFVDSAILSTSIKSTQSFGGSRTRFKIYLPAGTPMFPILNHSNMSDEKEIILPPYSLLKITEVHANFKKDGHRAFLAVYKGHGIKEFIKASKKQMILDHFNPSSLLEQDKEPKNYTKWTAPLASYEHSLAVQKMILKMK